MKNTLGLLVGVLLCGCIGAVDEMPDAGQQLMESDGGAPRVDAGELDAGLDDAGTEDAGAVDAGGIDAGEIDAGGIDAGAVDAGGIDAGVPDAGVPDAGSVDAGAPDAGPMRPPVTCATPAQDAVDLTGWPELFVGTQAQGCADDSAAGTRSRPLCNPHLAMGRLTSAGRIVTFRDGTYRLDDFATGSGGRGGLSVPSVGATASRFTVLRAEQGARPVLLGSVQVSGSWAQHSTNPRVFRRAIDLVARDITALYQVVDGPSAQFTRARRFRHVMESRQGVRSHAPVAFLADGAPGSVETSMTESGATRSFTWTKATSSGAGCGASNAGCYLYLRADDAAFDPNTLAFEVPQHTGLGGNGNFVVIDGLHTRFTQCHGQNCSVHFEGVRQALIQNSSFGHVSNSDDNSYGLALWFSNGSIVRRNVVFDSAYWGGVSNSKGITFMVSGDEAPNWVCENEVFHIPGQAGISTKGGVSNLYVLGNYVHDSYMGIESSHVRVQDGQTYPAGNWTISRNVVERCGAGVSLSRNGSSSAQPGDEIANNLFLSNGAGVQFTNSTPPDVRVHDNIFIGPPGAAACGAQVCDTGMYFSNNAGQVRDFDFLFDAPFNLRTSHNLFFGFRWTHGVNHNWTPSYTNRTLPTFQAAFASAGAEAGSLVADPLLDAQYRPTPGSPVLGAGLDGGNIGPY